MKSILKRLIALALLFSFIQSGSTCSGQSSNLPDTLILKTKQVKGPGLMYYLSGINDLKFQSIDSMAYDVILPENVHDVQVAVELADYNIYNYERALKSGIDTSKFYRTLIAQKKIFPERLLSFKENSVCFLKGVKGKDTILIVDENNNKDFRDDPIRPVEKIDYKSKDRLFKCDYTIYNGEKYITASNWITIGTWRDDGIWFLSNQHFTTELTLGKSTYDIELFSWDTRFWFYEPQIALIGANGFKRDTVLQGEILNIGEYLKLKEGIYKFEKMSNDASTITLIREDHYDSISGTQIGSLAPDFKCETTDGDSISLKDYKGVNVLLVNISACYSLPGSQEVYKDLYGTYGSKVEMVVIDRAGGYLKELETWSQTGKLVNADIPANVSFAKNYRPDYCSRTCFLIGPDGRIVDKFEIFDWDKNLPKHLKGIN